MYNADSRSGFTARIFFLKKIGFWISGKRRPASRDRAQETDIAKTGCPRQKRLVRDCPRPTDYRMMHSLHTRRPELMLTLLLLVAGACCTTGQPGAHTQPDPAFQADARAAERLLLFESEQGNYGFRDRSTGTVVIPAVYAMATEFNSSGVSYVIRERHWRCLDASNRLGPAIFTFDNGPDPLAAGLQRYVDARGRFGYVDAACRVKIPARFGVGEPFENGQARVCMDCRLVADGEHHRVTSSQWFVINVAGHFIEP